MTFKKGHKHTEETKRKISKASKGHKPNKTSFKKGHISWSKGKKLGPNPEHSKRMKGKKLRLGKYHTEESKKKMSESHKGKKLTGEHKKNISRGNTGKRYSKETIMKLSRQKRGDKNPNWKGGITKRFNKLRRGREYRIWRNALIERDNYTCIWCGSKENIQADHIKPFALFPELRFAIDNGRVLCKPCHIKTDTYGGKYRNKKVK